VVYGYVDTTMTKKITALKTFGAIFAILGALGILLLLCFCRAIRVAVAVIQVATDALRKLYHMILLPLLFIVFVGVHGVWTVAAAYYFYCTGTFDVKYNRFDFIAYSQDETTYAITSK